VSAGRKRRLLLAALAAVFLAPAPAQGQLGLDFSAPKKKEEKKKAEEKKVERPDQEHGEPMVLKPLELGKKGATAAAKGLAKERLDAAKKLLKDLGGDLKEFYLTMGGHDMVIVADAPSDEVIAKFSLAVGSLGSIRTTTLKAFPEAEYRKIIAALP